MTKTEYELLKYSKTEMESCSSSLAWFLPCSLVPVIIHFNRKLTAGYTTSKTVQK